MSPSWMPHSFSDFLSSVRGRPLNAMQISGAGNPVSTSQKALKFSSSKSSLTSKTNKSSDRVVTVTFIFKTVKIWINLRTSEVFTSTHNKNLQLHNHKAAMTPLCRERCEAIRSSLSRLVEGRVTWKRVTKKNVIFDLKISVSLVRLIWLDCCCDSYVCRWIYEWGSRIPAWEFGMVLTKTT